MPEAENFIRAMAFEVEPGGDGRTFEGYAVPFNVPAHVRDWAGEYEETIAPGAFDRSLRQRTPDFLYDHGTHPLIGNIPLGVISNIAADSKGYHIRARMSDNWLIQPVRDAIREGGISGMSVHFNFKGVPAGHQWIQASGSKRHHVTDGNLIELGPVLRPTYQFTTASIRSVLDKLPDQSPQEMVGGPDPRLQSTEQLRDRDLRIRGIIRG